MKHKSQHPVWQKFGKQPVFIDGAMGTLLQEKGLAAGEIPELWNLTHPAVLSDIHEAYLQAGCDIIEANTFGANRIKLHGVADPETVIAAALHLAGCRRKKWKSGAGSDGHWPDRAAAKTHGRFTL